MTEGLGASDLGDETTELQEEVLADLREIARGSAPGTAALDAFVSALDEAATTYRAAEAIRDAARPVNVRGELAALEATYRRLAERVNGLGALARHMLHGEAGDTGDTELRAALDTIADRIDAARTRAAEMPPGGAQSRRIARLYLAVDVARAMRRHLGIEPVITGGGLFDTLLKTLLEALRPDRDDLSVRDLMRDALAADDDGHPDGAIRVVCGGG